jgi:DNA-directed RNA polymerase subunit RPC12/RpoP
MEAISMATNYDSLFPERPRQEPPEFKMTIEMDVNCIRCYADVESVIYIPDKQLATFKCPKCNFINVIENFRFDL